jgi:hypothetical protein
MRHGIRRNRHLILRLIESATSPVARPGPFVLLWRWRYEVGLAIGAPGCWLLMDRQLGWTAAITTIAAVLFVAALWPPARTELAARMWCVITPHRIRKGMAQALIVTARGKLPIVFYTRPEAFGERLWIWCRAGTSPADLIGARDLLAAACWLASDVRIARHPDRASLAIVDVIRCPDRADRLDHADEKWRSPIGGKGV